MNKIFEFIDKWGIRISSILILIVFLKTCTTNSKIEKVKYLSNKTNERIDSLSIELKKEIQIEGLETERRMIQSTDRKMMDVTRQERIGNIIDSLRIKK